MQGDTRPPSNGEDRLEGEDFQDEGNYGGAEPESLAEDEEFVEGQPPEELPGHRLTRRQVLIGGAIAGGALIGGGAGAIYLLLRGDGDEDQVAGERPTPPATETPAPATVAPTEAPTQAPTPTVAPRPRLEYVEDAPGAIEERDWANGELIDWSHGLFAMNVSTGAVHGWRVAPALTSAGLPYEAHRFLGNGRHVCVTTAAYSYVLDRQTGSAVRMATDRLYPELATSQYVLLAETEHVAGGPTEIPSRTGRFQVATLDWGKTAEFTIRPDRWSDGQYRFLTQPAGSTLAAMTSGREDASVLELIDLQTGEHREVFRASPEVLRTEPGRSILQSVDGQSFRVTTEYGWWNAGLWRASFRLTRDVYWSGRIGELLFTTAPWDRLTFAPDGSFLRRQSLCGGSPVYDWPATAFYDREGRQQWRVRSLDAGSSVWHDEQAWWLADGSGFIGAIRSDVREDDCWYATVGRERGAISPLPRPPSTTILTWQRPIPSPHDVRFVSFNGTQVLNRNTGDWFSANLATQPPVGLDPWSARPGEMAFRMPFDLQNPLVPPFGPFLQPFFEGESFSECVSPLFRVSATGSCLNLRAEPNPQAEVLACLPDGTQVWLYSYGVPNPVVAGGDDVWVRISSDEGQVGWVSSDYLAWDVP